MPTTDVLNSTNYAFYAGGTKIALTTDVSVSLTHEPRDKTNKDSGKWRELLEGLLSGNGSCSGFYAHDAAYGFDDLWSSWVNRTTLVIKSSTAVSGDKYLQGTAYVGNLEVSSPGAQDNVTWSATFEFTGAITQGTET
jgi:predicted secreted protein